MSSFPQIRMTPGMGVWDHAQARSHPPASHQDLLASLRYDMNLQGNKSDAQWFKSGPSGPIYKLPSGTTSRLYDGKGAYRSRKKRVQRRRSEWKKKSKRRYAPKRRPVRRRLYMPTWIKKKYPYSDGWAVPVMEAEDEALLVDVANFIEASPPRVHKVARYPGLW